MAGGRSARIVRAAGRAGICLEPLTTPTKISGQPVAHLVASTSGSDADWVLKLIDVYPDEVAGQPAPWRLSLRFRLISFRGRYRESYESPKPIAE
ncbi:MAG: CocE/NonD family hydrolase C-terminal non-catalytic domain-containing protein [Verrucomicrobiota bacterium]